MEQEHPTHPEVAQDTGEDKSKSHHMHISKKHRVVKIEHVHTKNIVQTWE